MSTAHLSTDLNIDGNVTDIAVTAKRIQCLECGQEWDPSVGGGGGRHNCAKGSAKSIDHKVDDHNNNMDDIALNLSTNKRVNTPPIPTANNSVTDKPMDLSVDKALDFATDTSTPTTSGGGGGDNESDKPVDNMCYICLETMANNEMDTEDEGERSPVEAEECEGSSVEADECEGSAATAAIRELVCGHRFHEVCADTWLNEFRHYTCPYCTRIVMDPFEDEDDFDDDEGDEEYSAHFMPGAQHVADSLALSDDSVGNEDSDSEYL